MAEKINVLDKGFVTVIDEPDSDLKVVNAARVSFNKKSELRKYCPACAEDFPIHDTHCEAHANSPVPLGEPILSERDAKLIHYLSRNKHWTVFGHTRALVKVDLTINMMAWMCNTGGFAIKPLAETALSLDEPMCLLSFSLAHLLHKQMAPGYADAFKDICPVSCEALKAGCFDGRSRVYRLDWSEWPEETPVTLHFKMPLAIAAQFKRSNVGLVYNEVSRRYVDDPPEIHVPAQWRSRPEGSIKQGSGAAMDYQPGACGSYWLDNGPKSAEEVAIDEYERRLDQGVAPEQARFCLPVGTYTEFWATGSLQTWARVFCLRVDSHAQWEIQQYAHAINQILMDLHGDLWVMCHDIYRMETNQ